MKSKKIYILMGNPNMEGTLSMKMADAYELGALENGHEVRRQNLPEMKFDPILHKGYRAIQELEPDLKTFQANVKWCDHFVIVYPNWWCATPALLKGLFDRAWLPGFAFNFHKSGLWWTARLKGRSARLIMLANSHPWIQWFLFGEFTNELARATLGFAGFMPVKSTVFYPSEKVSETRKGWWLSKVRDLGRRAR
jgi:NAD(P)H dehydrogenase (quinone)